MQENIINNRKLGDKLYNYYKSEFQLRGIENTISKSGALTLKYNENFIHSAYDPEKEAEKFGLGKIEGKKIIFILGLGLGYHIKQLIQKTDAIIILIEISPGFFKNAYENIDLSFLTKIFFYTDKIENLYNYLIQMLPEEKCNSVEILPLISVVKFFQNEYEQVVNIINKVISQKLQSLITTIGFGERWIKNILINTILIKNSFTIKNKINSPIFILASGPTLDDAMPYIEAMKSKGKVFCLSHSLFALAANNIYPDAVFAIDGGFASRNHFSYLPEEVYEKTILITTLSVYPDVIRYWKGKICIVNIDLPLEKEIFPDALKLPVSGTVSATAFLFAKFLSPGPYYFAGLDLCYAKKKYHHKNSLSEQKFLYASNKFFTPETVLSSLMNKLNPLQTKNANGKLIKTNRAMKAYHDWFNNAFNKSNIYIFGKDGIYFENVKNIDYSELDNLKNSNCEMVLDKIFIDYENSIKKIKLILNNIENDVLNSQDEVLNMHFSRYKTNSVNLDYAIKKAKKIYFKALKVFEG